MQHNTFLKFIIFIFLFSINSFSEEIKCLKTSIIKGSHCNNLLISFNFSDCGIEGLTTEEVRSKCVNQKAVAFVKNENILYIATYGAPISDSPAESRHWRFLSLRKEEKKLDNSAVVSMNSSTPNNEMSVSIKKLPKTTSGVESESLPTPDLIAKVIVSPTVVPIPVVPSVETDEPKQNTEIKEEPKQEVKNEVNLDSSHKEAEAAVKISGFFDFYYLYNTNAPAVASGATSNNQFVTPANNPYRMFDQYHDNFNLSLAQISVKKDSAKVGGRLDLGFGNAAVVMAPLDGASQNILQAHVYYKLSDNVKLKAGKMISHMGAEEPYALENMNYSRSLLFTYGLPLWHTGLALETQILPKVFSVTFYSYNAWSGLNNINRRTGGVRLSYFNPERWTLNYNFISNTQENSDHQIRQVHELNYSMKATDQFQILVDSIWGYETRAFATTGVDAQWTALSFGLQWKKGIYLLSPRIEYFYDPQGYAIDGRLGENTNSKTYINQNIMSYTLTNTWLFEEGGKILFELREDISDRNVFHDADKKALAAQTSASLAFILDF